MNPYEPPSEVSQFEERTAGNRTAIPKSHLVLYAYLAALIVYVLCVPMFNP